MAININIAGEVNEWMLWDVEYMLDYIAKKDEEVNVFVDSTGGYVTAGVQIFNKLKRHSGKVTAYIDGFAASMASVIPLAADEVVLSDNAIVMIHDPLTVTPGNIRDHKASLQMLEKIKDSIVSIYSKKMNIDDKKIRQMMEDETWMNADEALAIGFADRKETEITNNSQQNSAMNAVAGVVARVENFKNIPKEIESKIKGITKEDETNGLNSSINKKKEVENGMNENTEKTEQAANAADLEAAKAQAQTEAAKKAQARVTSIINVFNDAGLQGHAKMSELLTDSSAGEIEALKACNEILKENASKVEETQNQTPQKTAAELELEARNNDAKVVDQVGQSTADDLKEKTGKLNVNSFKTGFGAVLPADTGE